MHYLLFYEKVPDHESREGPHREAHRNHVCAAIRRGDVVLAGSLADPADGSALLVFREDGQSKAVTFAREDPYVVHGIVRTWSVRGWQTISAAAPG
jgi:uncharacterized protein YciI